MKQRVAYSTYSIIITLIIFMTFLLLSSSNLTQGILFRKYLLFLVITSLLIGSLFYMPLSVDVNEKRLRARRPILSKEINISDIQSIILCPPTIGEQRLFGSGGFLGYWGWFREKNIGKYFAYFGKSSDCFLIRLKNGQLYRIGCKNPKAIVDYIQERIN